MTISILKATYEPEGAVLLELSIDGEFTYCAYRENDPYSGAMGVSLRDWISQNQGMISPYTVPVLTPEEIRSGMPSLTSRQFWMAAANIDIDKDVIIAAIKAEVPDGVDRKMMIAELESGSFERLNPTIIDVINLMDIPAYQVDSLWLWAAAL